MVERIISPAREALIAYGSKVREARSLRGMSQADLAKALGTGAPHLSQIETGKVNVTLQVMSKIASTLDMPITFFFEDN